MTMEAASPVVPYGTKLSFAKIVNSQSVVRIAGIENHTALRSHLEILSFWHSNRPPTKAAAKKNPNECCVHHCKLAERQLSASIMDPSYPLMIASDAMVRKS